MAKNYAGLGISFFPVDKGAQKAVQDMTSELEETNKELDEIDEKGKKGFKGLKDSFKELQAGFSANIEKMKAHASSIDTNVNLSSNLESTFLQASVSADKLAAQTGVSAQEMKKATGFFHSLNMDAEDLQKAFVRLEHSSIDVSKIGFDNFQSLAKFSNVMGTTTEALTKDLQNLRLSYGYTDEQLQEFIDTNAAAGQELGVAGSVFQNMGDIVGVLDEHFAKLDLDATPEQFNEMATSVNLLAGAFHEAGGSVDDAAGFATGLMGRLTDVQFQMKQLASGASGELPELMQNLGMSMGDFQAASEALSDDPLQFVQMMSERLGGMSDDQKEFFQAWSAENLGSDLTWLIANYSKVADKVEAAEARMKDATGTAQELSKAYSDGRTRAERYALQTDAFEKRLFGLAKQSGVVKSVLKGQRQTHKALGDLLAKQVEKGGPLGAITQIMITYRKMGVLPAIAATVELADQFPGFNRLVSDFGDNIFNVKEALLDLVRDKISFTEFMIRLKKEVKDATPRIKALFKDIGKSIQGGFKEVFPEASAMLGGLKEKLGGFGQMAGIGAGAASVGRAAMMSGPLAPYVAAVGGIGLIQSRWEGGIAGFAESAVKTFQKHFPKIAEGVKEELPKLARSLGESIPGVLDQYANFVDFMADYMGSLDWEKIGSQVGDLFGDALKGVIDLGSDIILGIFNLMLGEAEKNEQTVGGKILNALLKMWINIISGLGKAMLGLVKGLLESLAEPVVSWLMQNEQSFLNFREFIFSNLFDVYDSVMDATAEIKGSMTGMWESFVEAGSNALGLISAAFKLFKALVVHRVIAPVVRTIEDMAVGMFQIVQGVVSKIPDKMAFLLPGGAGTKKAIMGMDPEDFRVSTELGMDRASAAAAFGEVQAEFQAVAGTGGAGAKEANLLSIMAKQLKVNEEQLKEQKKQNSPDRGPIRPRVEEP